jgi:hypothetical protein
MVDERQWMSEYIAGVRGSEESVIEQWSSSWKQRVYAGEEKEQRRWKFIKRQMNVEVVGILMSAFHVDVDEIPAALWQQSLDFDVSDDLVSERGVGFPRVVGRLGLLTENQVLV